MQQENQHNGTTRAITLRTLLLIFTGGLVLLLLVVSMSISFNRFHRYLIEELEAQTRDAATAIGLSLSNAIDATDPVAVSSLIDSVFDSSEYLKVEFLDHDENVVAGRSEALTGVDVPQWFVRAADLPTPEGTAAVMSGWQWLGEVRVVGHPGNGYRALWRITQSLILASVVIGAVAIAVLFLLLGRLLRPLRALENQAEAVRQRDFRKRTQVRSTRELNQVTQAMNQMTDDLEQLFAGQAALIAHLRKLNNEDALTGLASRNAFDQRLSVEAVSEEGRRQGSLVLVQVSRFADFNQRAGRLEADALLVQLSKCVHEFVGDHAGSFGGRRSGAEFAVFVPGGAPADTLIWSRELVDNLQSVCGEYAGEGGNALVDLLVHAGIAGTGDGVSVRTLFESADAALRRAQTEGIPHCELADGGVDVHYGADDWRRLLTEALESEALWLWTQPVLAAIDDSLLYRQVFSRLYIEREWVRGNEFAPMAERFGLMGQLDLKVLQRALYRVRQEPEEVIGLSLGASSVVAPEIPEQLLAMARAAGPAVMQCIWVGIPEQALHYHRQEAQRFIRQMRRTGANLLVERFGVGGIPFSYMKNLSIQALRIDSSFIRGIDRHEENRFFLESAVTIARGRGVKVFASGVETESEWRTLKSIGVDGGSGYQLGRPAPVGEPPFPG